VLMASKPTRASKTNTGGQRILVTSQRLKELLHYDSTSGIFTWLVKRGRQAAGSEAGCLNKVWGYYYIGIDGEIYRRNRLAWLYVYGAWPVHEIDHIDGVTTNDAIANLRDVTRSQNMQNRRAGSNSRSGILGVSPDRHGKWIAQIKATNAKTRHLRTFDTPQEAQSAYLEAKRIFHI